MKKILFVLLMICFALGLSACDGTPDSNSYSLMDPDYEYELDTWMENSEIYEFTPRSNSSMSCVMLMLDSGKAVGLQCFPKKEK